MQPKPLCDEHVHNQDPHPTLNPEYNLRLKHWKDLGAFSEPECEGCGKDLTGQNVFEATTGWFCQECYEEECDTVIDAAPYAEIVSSRG